MGHFAPIRDYVETWVHPSAQANALTAVRHRVFIVPRLIGGVVALAALPAYLLLRGAPSAIELSMFGWLVVPILIAYYLSRTGRYQSAHVLWSLALTALITALAACTGGLGSFAALWLVIVPLEAVLTASRRVIAVSSAFAIGAVGLLMLLGAAQAIPPAATVGGDALVAFGIIATILYASGLALGTEALARVANDVIGEQQDRYGLLAGNVTDAITCHSSDGALCFASRGAEALFGAPLATLYGNGLFDRVHVADRPAYLSAVGDAAVAKESRSVEIRVRCAAGEAEACPQFTWIEMRCRPVTPARRDGCAVVAVLRDVSERKQQQQDAEDARVRAEQANAGKSRFLATMTHELRTPLNAIIGFSDLLMNESPALDAARRSEYAGLINGAGRHLLAIVNSVLDVSKIETGNFALVPEPVRPAKVIAECEAMVAVQAREKGVEIVDCTSSDLPEIVADRRALSQILLNLLSNAIRFSERGGKIAVAGRGEAASVVFTVEDQGIGISERDLAQLCEPYFQARSSSDRRHDGSGLGLFIVNGLVRLHGGELSIRSRVGEGTRVTVRLPLDCERASAPTDRAAHASPDSSRVVQPLTPPAAKGVSARPGVSASQRLPQRAAADLRMKKSA